ncbi:hypothetical protein M0D69_13900 [Caballeronia sp. SEWSISQ10-4 2]|uniref:hypothetical protein n=1 Tax=Caballeronia sp. SEWSISQ10-4 2 TaxID=2937438 RepID=UPI0026570E09|nr:hypothetical protein [Caballeronia sp. SEWSISQ10-4 2]MDN7179087.1 hypothetical protein [Caballeronia sp. SEWSISQ10-4 2]
MGLFSRILPSGKPKPHLRHGFRGYWMVENVNQQTCYPEKGQAYDFAHIKNTTLFNDRLGILKLSTG